MAHYRRRAQEKGREILTIGIGDSLNDLPLLPVIDRPILLQRPDGSFDPSVQLPNLCYAAGIGPIGWNEAMRTTLNLS